MESAANGTALDVNDTTSPPVPNGSRPTRAAGNRLAIWTILASAFAVLPPAALALGFSVWNQPQTDVYWGFALLGGLTIGLALGALGILSLVAGHRWSGATGLGGAAVAGLTALITFGVGFATPVPIWGEHVGPGTCENADIRVTLQSQQDEAWEHVSFVVTSKAEPLSNYPMGAYGWGKITGGSHSQRIGNEWELAAGETRTIHLAAHGPLPAEPWIEFTFVYAIETHSTYLRCNIAGDDLPST